MAEEVNEFDELNMDVFNEISDPIMEDTEEEVETPNEEIEDINKDKESGEQEEDDSTAERVAGEQDDEEDEPSKKEQTSSPSLYSSLAKVLSEEGLLPSYDPEKSKFESKEEFIEAFRESIKNSEYSDLSDTQKEYLQAIRAGLPHEEVKQQLSIEENLNNIKSEELESNEELRRQLIHGSFVTKGYSEEKAKKLTQRSFDIGEDLNDSLESLEDLKEHSKKEYQLRIQQAEESKKEAQRKNQEQLDKLKETIVSFTEIIPGQKVTEKDKQKIFEQATKPVAEFNGRPINAAMKAKLENPVEFEAKFNYLFYITKGFKDFNVIKTKAKTSATKELEDLIRGNTFIPKGSESTENLDYDPYDSAFSKDVIDNII